MSMLYWFDTEFIDTGSVIDMISIGIVSEDGRAYYAESSECDLSRACPWVKEHVIPLLRGNAKDRKTIAGEIREFVVDRPVFWTYYGAYDWVVMSQLYGRMLDVPERWPHFAHDLVSAATLKGERVISRRGVGVHNALQDALWLKRAWMSLFGEERVLSVERNSKEA